MLGSRRWQITPRKLSAKFADDDDVRVFTQRALECSGKRVGVLAHFALADVAALGRLHDLNGIFDSDDVVGARLFVIRDHRSERGGLA